MLTTHELVAVTIDHSAHMLRATHLLGSGHAAANRDVAVQARASGTRKRLVLAVDLECAAWLVQQPRLVEALR